MSVDENLAGFDLLKAKLLDMGFNGKQLTSKVIPAVYEIVTQNPKTQDLWQAEETLGRIKRYADDMRENFNNIREIVSKQDEKYEAYYSSLLAGETPEARDALRTAQLFIQAVEVDTKYDNTAFIIGLASILAGKNIAPMERLQKLNPKLFENTWYGKSFLEGEARDILSSAEFEEYQGRDLLAKTLREVVKQD